MQKQKVRHAVFKKAAKLVQKRLDSDIGITCCEALRITLHQRNIGDIRNTAEYKFFKKMFCNNRSQYDFWFGRTSCQWYSSMANITNQKKRIDALMKAYNKARRMNESKK